MVIHRADWPRSSSIISFVRVGRSKTRAAYAYMTTGKDRSMTEARSASESAERFDTLRCRKPATTSTFAAGNLLGDEQWAISGEVGFELLPVDARGKDY
jgi:transcription-repair coupling factor (superfamily II helicase)